MSLEANSEWVYFLKKKKVCNSKLRKMIAILKNLVCNDINSEPII